MRYDLGTQRWKRLRRFVLCRDNHRCYWCKGRATTADHLVSPREGGAKYDPANVVASCGPCNYSRGAHLLKAMAVGEYFGSRRGRAYDRRPDPTVGAIRLQDRGLA